MNNRLTLIEIIAHILKNSPDQYFTAKEIAENVFKKFPDWCENKKRNSKQDLGTDNKLINQVKSEILSKIVALQKKDSNYQILEEKPRKLFYSTKNNVKKSDNVQQVIKGNFSENDLYPLLAKYLRTVHTIYSKRIDEKRSKNSRGQGGNKWLFPDMVGLEITGETWL